MNIDIHMFISSSAGINEVVCKSRCGNLCPPLSYGEVNKGSIWGGDSKHGCEFS